MPKAPVPEELIKQMYQLRQQGLTYEKIAWKVGLTPQTVRYYLVGRPISGQIIMDLKSQEDKP